mgnify:FL=1
MKGLFCTSVLVGDDSSLAALAAVLSSAGVEPTRCVEPLAYLSGSAAHPFASPLPGAMDVRIVIADLPSVNSAGFTQVRCLMLHQRCSRHFTRPFTTIARRRSLSTHAHRTAPYTTCLPHTYPPLPRAG